MKETKNKIQSTFSLDRDIVLAFDKYCPPGERSTTINEILKDFLEKRKVMNVNVSEQLVEKQLIASKALQEYESLKAELEAKERRQTEYLDKQRVDRERKNFFSNKNEEAKRLARDEVLKELGVLDYSSIPADIQPVFVQRWRVRSEEKLRELLALEVNE